MEVHTHTRTRTGARKTIPATPAAPSVACTYRVGQKTGQFFKVYD